MSMDFVKNVVLYAFFGVFGLLVGFGDWRQTACNAFAVGFQLLFVTERHFNWRSRKIEGFAQSSLQITLVAPVDKFQIAAVDNKPRRSNVSLDNVTKFRM